MYNCQQLSTNREKTGGDSYIIPVGGSLWLSIIGTDNWTT